MARMSVCETYSDEFQASPMVACRISSYEGAFRCGCAIGGRVGFQYGRVHLMNFGAKSELGMEQYINNIHQIVQLVYFFMLMQKRNVINSVQQIKKMKFVTRGVEENTKDFGGCANSSLTVEIMTKIDLFKWYVERIGRI
uniref:Uncharacterized protein n=1 Tax=Spironucleus salmonicida TaxID=348837 RepID=V6LMU2_9EUKA|eukprot:EST45386.1 Hypothetical protein SS50377_14717 [Spironucleus salmonicida]